jgi:uncharacterized protein YqgC (DUF456 family)
LSFLATAGLAVFILILFAGIYINLFGLPGTLVIFFDVLFYAIFTGFDRIGWKILLFLFIAAVIAEIIDFLLDMYGGLKPIDAKKTFGASAIGAITGTVILTPLFWGPGIWAGFFLGGLAGLLIVEFLRQSKLRAPFRATHRAIFAMVGRKLLKGVIALFMVAVSLSNIYS